jgi:uncharacterized protein (TIGR02246 family)
MNVSAGHQIRETTDMREDAASEVARANAAVVQRFNDALNTRDRAAVIAAFAVDGVFRPGGAGESFEGRQAATSRMFGFLEQHAAGELESLTVFASGDEVFNEWRWTGTTLEGESVESHGADYFRLRDGQIILRSTFVKV